MVCKLQLSRFNDNELVGYQNPCAVLHPVAFENFIFGSFSLEGQFEKLVVRCFFGT